MLLVKQWLNIHAEFHSDQLNISRHDDFILYTEKIEYVLEKIYINPETRFENDKNGKYLLSKH